MLILLKKIYGKDVASLKGKITREKPTPVVHDVVRIPNELINAQRDVDLCFDVMFVNEIPFITTISKHIKYRTAEAVPNKQLKSYRSALSNIIHIYQNAEFQVTHVSCN